MRDERCARRAPSQGRLWLAAMACSRLNYTHPIHQLAGCTESCWGCRSEKLRERRAEGRPMCAPGAHPGSAAAADNHDGQHRWGRLTGVRRRCRPSCLRAFRKPTTSHAMHACTTEPMLASFAPQAPQSCCRRRRRLPPLECSPSCAVQARRLRKRQHPARSQWQQRPKWQGGHQRRCCRYWRHRWQGRAGQQL